MPKIKIGDRIIGFGNFLNDNGWYTVYLETGEILHTDFKQEAKLINGTL